MKDLKELHQAVEMCFEHFGLENPAFVIAFTCDPDRDQVFYCGNMGIDDSVKVLKETAEKIVIRNN